MSAATFGTRAALLLAAPDDNIPPGKGPEWGKAAPIGLLVILLLGVALFFLIKNMNKQFRKVPASFDPPSDEVIESVDDPAEPGEADGAADGDADRTDPPDATDGSAGRTVQEAVEPAAEDRTRRGEVGAGGVSAPPAGELRD